MTKKTIIERHFMDSDDLCGPIDDVVARLLRAKAEKGYSGVTCEYGWDGYAEWYYETTRLETDMEYLARLEKEETARKREQKEKQKSKEQRRTQYEKLRAEFEGTS